MPTAVSSIEAKMCDHHGFVISLRIGGIWRPQLADTVAQSACAMETKNLYLSDEGIYFWSIDHIKEPFRSGRRRRSKWIGKVDERVPGWQASPYLRSTTASIPSRSD